MKSAKVDAVSRVYWYNSTVDLTLDTVSVFVTQYNGSAVTNKQTVHGQLSTFNVSADTKAQALASSIFTGFNPEYDEDPLLILANGTDGSLAPGTSIPYPTPYVGLSRFYYVTMSTTTCSPVGPSSCGCPLTNLNGFLEVSDQGAVSSLVDLPSLYYQAFPNVVDLGSGIGSGTNRLDLDNFNVSFSQWVLSHVTLSNIGPPLASCFFFNGIYGPPAAKIPVAALTATVTAPLAFGTQPPPNAPAPANPIIPPTSPKTPAPAAPKPQPAPGPQPASNPDDALKPQPAPEPVNPPEQQPEANPPSAQAPPRQPGSQVPGPAHDPSGQDTPPSLPEPPASNPEPAPQSPEPAPQSPEPFPQSPGPAPQSPEPAPQPPRPADPAGLPSPKPQPGASQGGTSEGQEAPAPPDSQPAPGPQQLSGNQPGNNDHLPPSLPYSPNAPDPEAGQSTNPNLDGQGGGSDNLDGGNSGGKGALGQPSVYLENSPAVLTVAGSRYSADASSNFIIASQTLKPGGTALTVGGDELSMVSNGDIAYIGRSTQTLEKATPQPEPVISFQGSLYTADGSSGFSIDTHRLTPGGVITADSTPISLQPNGKEAIIGTSTQHLLPTSTADHPIFTLNGATYSVDVSSGFIIDGQTLTPGAAITNHGTVISLPSGASAVVVGTSMQSLIPLVTSSAVVTIGGSTYTLDSASGFIMDGQTLSPGAAITQHGTVISLPIGASEIVVGTSTQSFMPLVTSPAEITVGDSTYTMDSASDFIIDGQTLTEGGVITVNGTPISYATNGADVMVATSTEAIEIGGLIMSGFGTGSSSSTEATTAQTGVIQFTGSAPRDLSPKPSSSVRGIIVAIILGLAF